MREQDVFLQQWTIVSWSALLRLIYSQLHFLTTEFKFKQLLWWGLNLCTRTWAQGLKVLLGGELWSYRVNTSTCHWWLRHCCPVRVDPLRSLIFPWKHRKIGAGGGHSALRACSAIHKRKGQKKLQHRNRTFGPSRLCRSWCLPKLKPYALTKSTSFRSHPIHVFI